jgi:hypothetical protein
MASLAGEVVAAASKKSGADVRVEEERHRHRSGRGASQMSEWKRSGGGVAPKWSGGELK